MRQSTNLVLKHFVFCFSVIFASTSFASPSTPKTTPTAAKPALTVTTAMPKSTQLPIHLSAHGNVAAWQEAVISSESAGLRLTAVKVNVGDYVHAGDELATFNQESVLSDIAVAKANVGEAEVALSEAKKNAERARQLQGTGAMSGQEIEHLLAAEQSAHAKVESAKAQLASQQLRLKYTRVLAPDSGIISARQATLGSVVGQGAELFRLIRQGRLEWRAEVTSAELTKLNVGMNVIFSDAKGGQIKGKIRQIAPTVDAQSRVGLVYVDVPNGTGLRAGMFAKGEFELGGSGALTVPQQAVVVRDGFSYVFRLNQDQHVSQVKVTTGRRLKDSVEVLEGLQANQQVVVQGAGFLNDGDLVKSVKP